MSTPPANRIEVVRGRVDEALAERLVGFWTANGALDEPAARERIRDVVCVLWDGDGEIAGVNSVFAAKAPLIDRRMWLYRRFIAGTPRDDDELELVAAAFARLESEFTGAVSDPVGLCVLIGDRAAMERHREAVWPRLELVYAGYTEAGEQVRVRYFTGAKV